jgi:hypothetical protein
MKMVDRSHIKDSIWCGVRTPLNAKTFNALEDEVESKIEKGHDLRLSATQDLEDNIIRSTHQSTGETA